MRKLVIVVLTLLLVISLPPLYVSVVNSQSWGLDSSFQKNTVYFMSPHDKTLPLEAQYAITKALNNSTFKSARLYIVSASKGSQDEDWYIGSFTDTDLSIKRNIPGDLYTYIVVRGARGDWLATTNKDLEKDDVLNAIPQDQLSNLAKNAVFGTELPIENIESNQTVMLLTPTYKLPWTQGQTWQVTQGWHSNVAEYTYQTMHSLDFDIVGATNGNILAIAPGTITASCFGSAGQVYLGITTDTSQERWGYLHLDANSVNLLGLHEGVHVYQGQLLGHMREADSETVSDNCGTSVGTHFHFYFPSKPQTLDGVSFSDSNSHSGELLSQSTNVEATGCGGANAVMSNTTVLSNQTFYCYASNSITIYPETVVQQGAEFFAGIFSL